MSEKQKLTCFLEDSIFRKNRLASAGSKMLDGFAAPFDATVVSRLEAANVEILGEIKSNEFGIAGLFDEAADFVSDSISAVENDVADIVLCNDFSGAIRSRSAERGLYYIHPTYGTVSRFGLIPSVSSMDQIGILCKSPQKGFYALSIISGHDPKDGAMYDPKFIDGEAQPDPEKVITKIGVPENVFSADEKSVAVKAAKDFGFEIISFNLEHFEVFSHVMRILSCGEISGNLSRYDGIKFGHRTENFMDLQELYTKSRTEGFGSYAKLAVIMGTMLLSSEYYNDYYDKAMRIRRIIKDSVKFDEFDMILMPTDDANPSRRLAKNVLPQLCGLPSLTMPCCGKGFSLIANAGKENTLLSALKQIEAVAG